MGNKPFDGHDFSKPPMMNSSAIVKNDEEQKNERKMDSEEQSKKVEKIEKKIDDQNFQSKNHQKDWKEIVKSSEIHHHEILNNQTKLYSIFTDITSENEKLDEEIIKYQMEIKKLNDEKSQILKEKIECDGINTNLLNEVEIYKNEKEVKNKEINKLTIELSKLKDELKNETADKQNKINNLLEAMIEKQEKIDKLKELIQSKDQAIEDFKDQRKKFEEEIFMLKSFRSASLKYKVSTKKKMIEQENFDFKL